MSIALAFVRSLVFALIEAALTVIFGIIALLSFALPPHTRYRIITLWTHSVLWLVAHICGLRFRVLGRERDDRRLILARAPTAPPRSHAPPPTAPPRVAATAATSAGGWR